MRPYVTRIESVRRRRCALSRAKPDLRSILALHKELNPVRGCPILVTIDASTGQLFFTAASGLCSDRDRASSESVQRMVYETWPQLRPSA